MDEAPPTESDMPDVDAPRSSDATPDAALSRPRAINPWVVAIALLLGAMFVNFWTLGDSPLARTEGHRALTGHELTVRGEWVTPTLYGEVYLRKPPGHYWLIAVTEIVTGQSNEWVWRLPSALAAVGVVMLMWVMGRRWFGEIGGAAAGLSCLGMVALWSQNRAAEIDALNTLATVGCACCVLECGFGPTRRRWAWGIGIAVSMAWLLFLKGPAGLPLVGGVFIGASIATQKWAWAKRPSVWVSVIAGIAIFGAWGVAAAVTMKAQPGATDTSGPNEVLNRLTPEDMSHLIKAALMPLTLIGYSMPWSAAVLLGLIPSVTRSMDDHKTRYRARAAIGTVVAAMCVCGMVLMTRPRYGYITLPMVSLVVAAFAESWHRGYFDERLRAILRQIMTITAMLFAGLCGVLTWMSWQEGSEHRAWLIGGAVATGLLLVVAVGAWVMKKHRPGTWAVALMIVTPRSSFSR